MTVNETKHYMTRHSAASAETPLSPPPAETSRGEPVKRLLDAVHALLDDGELRLRQRYGFASKSLNELYEAVASMDAASPPPTVTEDYAGLIEELQQPHEWGYRDPVEGGFIADDRPFKAAQALRTLQQENPLLREAWEPSASEAIEIATLRQKNKELEEERDRLKSLCTEGMWETVESEQGWKRRALAAEAALTASQAEAERLRGEVERLKEEHLLGTAFARVAELEDENATLSKALEPFSEAADHYSGEQDDDEHVDNDSIITVGHLRDARAALSKKPAAEEGLANASCTLREQGKAYPRTCRVCGLGPCRKPAAEEEKTHD